MTLQEGPEPSAELQSMGSFQQEHPSRKAAWLTPGLATGTQAWLPQGSKMPLSAGVPLDVGRSCVWYKGSIP